MEERRRRGVKRARHMSAWEDTLWDDLASASAVDGFLASSRALSTVATYAVQRSQFVQFCDILGVRGSDRFTPDVLCRWIMGRACNDYRLSSIELGLHAIADWLPSRRMLADTDVVRALRAASRRPSAVRRQKQPILGPLLSLLVPALPSYWRQARVYAFWLLAWYGMFRGAEIVDRTWADISVRPAGLVIFVARSKTDQAGQGHFGYLHHAEDEVLCPLRALRRFVDFCPEDRPLRGPVFAVHPGADRAVSKSTMLIRLHRALDAVGQNSELFGLHSLRSGGATAACAAGVPERMIKVHGRWVSDVVRLYMCALPADRWAVSAAMQA